MKKFGIAFILSLVIVSMVIAQDATPAECGDILENEFTLDNQPQEYSIELSAGTQINVEGAAFGDTLVFSIVIFAPNDAVIAYNSLDANGSMGSASAGESHPIATTGTVAANGVYTIMAYNGGIVRRNGNPDDSRQSGGVGVYTLYIGCTLRDGTEIEPGESQSEPPELPENDNPTFSGFGFPGLASVDFSAGIEIPITLGQPIPAPLAADLVALYSYTASAGEVRTLSLSRASGNISIGVTVIKKDNNEIVFLGGMPSSNNLSVELTFPSAGDYVIGLFVLNTSTLTGSSGAVTVQLD
jgi:hypothetical protein